MSCNQIEKISTFASFASPSAVLAAPIFNEDQDVSQMHNLASEHGRQVMYESVNHFDRNYIAVIGMYTRFTLDALKNLKSCVVRGARYGRYDHNIAYVNGWYTAYQNYAMKFKTFIEECKCIDLFVSLTDAYPVGPNNFDLLTGMISCFDVVVERLQMFYGDLFIETHINDAFNSAQSKINKNFSIVHQCSRRSLYHTFVIHGMFIPMSLENDCASGEARFFRELNKCVYKIDEYKKNFFYNCSENRMMLLDDVPDKIESADVEVKVEVVAEVVVAPAPILVAPEVVVAAAPEVILAAPTPIMAVPKVVAPAPAPVFVAPAPAPVFVAPSIDIKNKNDVVVDVSAAAPGCPKPASAKHSRTFIAWFILFLAVVFGIIIFVVKIGVRVYFARKDKVASKASKSNRKSDRKASKVPRSTEAVPKSANAPRKVEVNHSNVNGLVSGCAHFSASFACSGQAQLHSGGSLNNYM